MMLLMMMLLLLLLMMMVVMFTMSTIAPHCMNQDEEIAMKAKIMILPQMFRRRSPIKGKGRTRCSKMTPHVHWKSMKKQKCMRYKIYIYLHNDSKTWWIFHVSSKECLFQCCINRYMHDAQMIELKCLKCLFEMKLSTVILLDHWQLTWTIHIYDTVHNYIYTYSSYIYIYWCICICIFSPFCVPGCIAATGAMYLQKSHWHWHSVPLWGSNTSWSSQILRECRREKHQWVPGKHRLHRVFLKASSSKQL